MKRSLLLFVAIVVAPAVTSCAKFRPMRDTPVDSERVPTRKAEEIDRTRSSTGEMDQETDRSDEAVGATEAFAARSERAAGEAAAAAESEAGVGGGAGSAASTAGFDPGRLPEDAKAGECFARVLIPPTHDVMTEHVLKSPASERVQVTPAKFEWAEEQIVVKEASERIEVVPAAFEWVEEQVVVKSASTELVNIPAKYEWIEQKTLVEPARKIWKKGQGPIQRVDNATGEIMCLVEVPATYKTLRKRVLVEPARTQEVEIPAEYKAVRRRVLTRPPSTQRIAIPAEYDTVKVRRLVSPPQETRIAIPAEFETVTWKVQATEARTEWRRVLCETNMSRAKIRAVQRALLDKGHDPGFIDGIYGRRTESAVRSFQQASRMPTGGLTIETIRALGEPDHQK